MPWRNPFFPLRMGMVSSLLYSTPGLAACNCTRSEKILTYWFVAGLLLLAFLVIFWMMRKQVKEAGRNASALQEIPHSPYRVTANFQVYDLRTREVVYRARSRPEALGWVERTLQLNPPAQDR